MARTKYRGPLDPTEYGRWVFENSPQRLALAVACQNRVVPRSGLGEVSHQEPGNATRTAERLVDWGVLDLVEAEGGETGFHLADRWTPQVEAAQLRSLEGRVVEGGVLLMIDRLGLRAFYEFVADRDKPDERLAWIARLPHHPSMGALALVNPALDEGAVERLTLELDEAGIGHERLVLGELAGLEHLRQLASASLPGAYGPGT